MHVSQSFQGTDMRSSTAHWAAGSSSHLCWPLVTPAPTAAQYTQLLQVLSAHLTTKLVTEIVKAEFHSALKASPGKEQWWENILFSQKLWNFEEFRKSFNISQIILSMSDILQHTASCKLKCSINTPVLIKSENKNSALQALLLTKAMPCTDTRAWLLCCHVLLCSVSCWTHRALLHYELPSPGRLADKYQLAKLPLFS